VVRRDWPPSFKIREAIALPVDDLIAVEDEKRGTWTLRRVHVGEDIIDLAVELAHRPRPFQDFARKSPEHCIAEPGCGAPLLYASCAKASFIGSRKAGLAAVRPKNGP
jgi:hypothetical protein